MTHRPFNRTRQLSRTLNLYESIIIPCDPRTTRGLPAGHYELILDLILDAESLEARQIQRLGDYLLELPGFAAGTREIGIDAASLAATINAYTFAEKLHLVDRGRFRNASRPPRTAS